MPIDYNVLPLKKGKTRKQIKARKDREDAKQLKAFRDAVWSRESDKAGWRLTTNYADCQHCGAEVQRGMGRRR